MALRDGRHLGMAEYGTPAGSPVFYFHGHPGSRLEPQFGDEAAREAGARIIALDRPGYGLSDFQRGRTLLDWPADVREVAEQLGLSQFTVVGGSGGGPYALACGLALPDRVTKVGLLSSVGPYGAPGVTRGMRWQNRLGFQWGSRLPPLASLMMWSMARQAQRRPEAVLDAVAQAMSPQDAAIVQRPEVRRVLRQTIEEAFRQGSRGAARDVVILGRHWGFDVKDVTVPAVLWQGEHDTLVPPPMGRYLAARLPHCDARFIPNAGHLLMIDRMPEVVSALLTP